MNFFTMNPNLNYERKNFFWVGGGGGDGAGLE